MVGNQIWGSGSTFSTTNVAVNFDNWIWKKITQSTTADRGLYWTYGDDTSTTEDETGFLFPTVKFELSQSATSNYSAAELWENHYREQTFASNGWIKCHWKWLDEKSPTDRLRDIIRQRQAPAVHVKNTDPIMPPKDFREQAARQTLRRVIGERGYRDFLSKGFVSVRAKSGDVYQLFPGHEITRVYRDGKQIERLCVVLKGDFPPTDSLIMRYLIILNDEAEFRRHAIRHAVLAPRLGGKPVDQRSLSEIYRELKRTAV